MSNMRTRENMLLKLNSTLFLDENIPAITVSRNVFSVFSKECWFYKQWQKQPKTFFSFILAFGKNDGLFIWWSQVATSTHFVFSVTLITDLISSMGNRATNHKLSGKCFELIPFDITQMLKISSVYLGWQASNGREHFTKLISVMEDFCFHRTCGTVTSSHQSQGIMCPTCPK